MYKKKNQSMINLFQNNQLLIYKIEGDYNKVKK